MGLFVFAWLVGEGIITYRSIKSLRMPPSPRELAVASGLYLGLAVIAEIQSARPVATAFAWAVDLAVLMQVLPGGTDSVASAGAQGWAGVGNAGNTVIIPDGSSASAINGTDSSTGGSASGTSTGSAGSGSGSAAANQATAQQVIAANPAFAGWGSGDQWQCLVNLWTKESSWSAQATNPGSGAYGISQSLHGTQGGQGGNEYNASASEGLSAGQLAGANSGDAADQILWGLNYIAATYGSPCAAWQHEQEDDWY